MRWLVALILLAAGVYYYHTHMRGEDVVDKAAESWNTVQEIQDDVGHAPARTVQSAKRAVNRAENAAANRAAAAAGVVQ